MTIETDVRWLTDAEQRTWRAYLRVVRLVEERLQAQLGAVSALTLPEYDLLVHLSEAPDHVLRMSELARLVVHSRSRLTHTVGRLEQRGLVRREACPDDRRGVNCLLTDEGFAALSSAAPGHVAEVRSTLFDCLTDAQIENLGDVLSTVQVHLEPTGPE